MNRARSGLRALILVVIGLIFSGAISSCSSIIGADDYEGSATALCDALALCYGIESCEDRIGSRLDLAPAEIRAEWLRNFSDFDCLSGCAAARRCLDFEPVCAIAGGCKRSEDCCGFIAGKTSCGKDGAGTQCCKKRGTSCSQSSDCCEGNCSPVTGTCGGVTCLDVGAECLDPFECCTGICDGGKCAPEVCRPDGFECSKPTECCSQLCDPQGVCATPSCGVVGASCDTTACCDGLSCVENSIFGKVCSDCPTGSPIGVACTTDDDCCSGQCDDDFKLCAAKCPVVGDPCEGDCCEGVCAEGTCTCQEFGSDCKENDDCCRGRCSSQGQCECSDDLCTDDADCCSNSCVGGACALDCIPAQCHDECKIGAPLDPETCTEAPNQQNCIAVVCQSDDYCCCQAWDDLCVKDAIAKCTTPCN